MRNLEAVVGGAEVVLNVVETPEEYREGARASGDALKRNEGYLFEYSIPQSLSFENTGVPYDLRVLFVQRIGTSNHGVVSYCQDMQRDSSKVASSFQDKFELAIELRRDFCEKHSIGKGSVVTLNSKEESDNEQS